MQHSNPAKIKIDALGYLFGGVGLLSMLFLAVPALLMMTTLKAKLVALFILVIGVLGLWWAVRRFAGIAERVAAVVCVVVGWYMLCGLLNVLNTMIFRL